MDPVRIIEVKKSILFNNEKKAAQIRENLHQQRTFLLNLMSSPGSGKTTLILRTVEQLRSEFKIGVIEADIDSAVDAERIQVEGIPAVQLQTGGMCHMDAGMTETGLKEINAAELDLVIVENIGNLVCTADFDIGAVRDVMILSVPEGDDKPLKYPLMFATSDVLLVNKIDYLQYADFNMTALKERVYGLNSDIDIFEISAKTGQGIEAWADWLRREIKQWIA
ncbi:MAG TPA: hydrogenase nickel incorporation protein HypB [Syntrophomonas sp.]|nr:hydrogenase nickel incorporation protein HypB [Syntrophomonas sp.]